MNEYRKRARNFTSKKENILVVLIKKYSNIFDCKASDARTNFKKLQYWDEIVEEFNNEADESYKP